MMPILPERSNGVGSSGPRSAGLDCRPDADRETRLDARLEELRGWATGQLGPLSSLEPASADASFRRYFRATTAEGSFILMDAPPAQEACGPFLAVAEHLRRIGVHAPEVLASSEADGFLLLEDLGGTHLLSALERGEDPDDLYSAALDSLVRMWSGGWTGDRPLPEYDRELMRREVDLFPRWLLSEHLGRDPSLDADRTDAVFERLMAEIEIQPRGFVHRDYHSRNLMYLGAGREPGVIDFQDAVIGPLSYDAVSLLKDCYVSWPRARVEAWMVQLLARAELDGPDPATWMRWLDFMGVQRHLKAAGIFCRLWYRDGKPGYLADIPRTLGYVVEAGDHVPELSAFSGWIRDEILPALAEAADPGELG